MPMSCMPMRDRAVCADTLRQGSRSFAAAALMLPSFQRAHARALYSFCRVADDLIDSADLASRPAVVASLRQRLHRACIGQPDDTPIDRAFAATLAACAIPHALPAALLEGFAWDAENRRYPDLPALRDYAARVAGSVGAMMALVLGVRDQHTLARAADLGVAMQLSNIARDIGEDARAGRLYMPLDWLREAGITPDRFLARPVFTPALGGLTARLLEEAERLYHRAEPGIARLPALSRPAIRAAMRLYREIGREVARQGGNGVDARAVVPPSRKLRLIAGSLHGANGPADAPALPETEFLLHAVPRIVIPVRENPVVWVLELFARLDQRDQLG
jgi:phytoene synthase